MVNNTFSLRQKSYGNKIPVGGSAQAGMSIHRGDCQRIALYGGVAPPAIPLKKRYLQHRSKSELSRQNKFTIYAATCRCFSYSFLDEYGAMVSLAQRIGLDAHPAKTS